MIEVQRFQSTETKINTGLQYKLFMLSLTFTLLAVHAPHNAEGTVSAINPKLRAQVLNYTACALASFTCNH